MLVTIEHIFYYNEKWSYCYLKTCFIIMIVKVIDIVSIRIHIIQFENEMYKQIIQYDGRIFMGIVHVSILINKSYQTNEYNYPIES